MRLASATLRIPIRLLMQGRGRCVRQRLQPLAILDAAIAVLHRAVTLWRLPLTWERSEILKRIAIFPFKTDERVLVHPRVPNKCKSGEFKSFSRAARLESNRSKSISQRPVPGSAPRAGA